MFSDVLLTVDYDRTLTGPDSRIPRGNLEAIRYFMDNGGTFTVNTGRSLPLTACFRDIVPVNAPLLLYNGSAAYDTKTGQLLDCHPIAIDPETMIRDLLEKMPPLAVELQSHRAHHLFAKDAGWEAYCTHNGGKWEYATPDDVPAPFLKLTVYGAFRDKTVNSMYMAEDWELALFEKATAYLQETYGDRVELFRAAPRILDIHAKGVSKGKAARALQGVLGKKILVCVGDAQNDVAMLEAADYAFCPADGGIADRYPNVCNCADGAVAEVIYKKIPEILGFSLDRRE